MVYCQQCGSENVADARFCVHCGAEIKKVQREQPQPERRPVEPPSEIAPQPEHTPPPRRPSAPEQPPGSEPRPSFAWWSNTKVIVAIVAVVAVVAFAVGLLLADPFGDDSGGGLPSVVIASPGNGAIVQDTVTISGTADASDGDIAKVQVRIGESGWIAVDGTTSWSYDWDTSTKQDGRIAVSARSYDGINYSRQDTVICDINNVGDVVEMSVQEFFGALGAAIDGEEMTWQSSIVGVEPDDVLQVSGRVSQLVFHNETEFPEIGAYTTVVLPHNETTSLPVHVVGNVTGVTQDDNAMVTLHVLNVSGSFPDMTNTTWDLSGEFFQEQFIFGIFAFDAARSNLVIAPDQIGKA